MLRRSDEINAYWRYRERQRLWRVIALDPGIKNVRTSRFHRKVSLRMRFTNAHLANLITRVCATNATKSNANGEEPRELILILRESVNRGRADSSSIVQFFSDSPRMCARLCKIDTFSALIRKTVVRYSSHVSENLKLRKWKIHFMDKNLRIPSGRNVQRVCNF